MANTDKILFNVNAHTVITKNISDIKDVLVPNSKTNDGFVTKGADQINKIWQTDSDGNPGWRPLTQGTYVGDTEPSASSQHLTWIDTGSTPALLKYRISVESSEWIPIGAIWS